VCWNDKGGKAERQTGGRVRRKEGIKEKRGFSRAARLRGSKITPVGSTLLRARTPGTAYKKEREKRKHLESGIITRLIIYADHYFDGADRPPSITFVPPLVLPAILLSFRDPALPQFPLTHPSRPSPCRHGRSFIILKLFVSVTAKTDIINSLPLERITVKRAALG